MTMIVQSTDSIGAGKRVSLLTSTDLTILSNATVASNDDTAIEAAGSAHDIQIYGAVVADNQGVRFTDLSGSNNLVRISESGSIYSSGSCVLFSSYANRLVNLGFISSDANAVAFSNSGTGSTLINVGTIEGQSGILSIGSIKISNYGNIWSSLTAIAASGDATSDSVLNKGNIVGEVNLFTGDDTFQNRGGFVDGNITLGLGVDRYDGRNGSVEGTVFGQEGSDTFITNPFETETIDGGAQGDVLDFRFGPAVIIALDGSFDNDGAALGDTYLNIENIYGSVKADIIAGSNQGNGIQGRGGADTIAGQGGADVMQGGLGVDTLTGGAGADAFRYMTLNEKGDIITDFRSVDDVINIEGSAFGFGSATGALSASRFQARADNAAQDSNDSFIFRTTDETLWFDADGNGAGAAVMIVDMQPGATMTAADIVII